MDPAEALAGMDELVEKILLRSPPDDPAHLVRAALVCKRWYRILADAGFRLRFRELHGPPPMLGFLYSNASSGTSFTATTSFRPRCADLRGRCALDSRHGRVLLAALPLLLKPTGKNMSVWNPVTGEQLELPKQPQHPEIVPLGWNAAVLCARGACDHLGCHRGPFLVVVVGATIDLVYVHVYSSETGAWRDPTFAAHYSGDPFNLLRHDPCAYVENSLCFMLYRDMESTILEYNLGTHGITQDVLPDDLGRGVLTTSENGGLGFARADWRTLYLWSREAGPDGHSIWVQSRSIDLGMMSARSISSRVIDCHGYLIWAQSQTDEPDMVFSCWIASRVIGSVHGLHVFFISTVDGLFSVDLKSGGAWRVCKDSDIESVVPYASFFIPALGDVSTVEGPSVDASSA